MNLHHSMIRYSEVNINFPEIWRVFISGCSSAGKTHLAQQLIESGMIKCSRIYYFHPDIHEQNPVDWNVIFQSGVPNLEFLLTLPENSCIILDDLFHECKDSKTIDYLFRVLSSKRKLHVLITTQRYFSKGSYALNIRNSCNIHVLMRNADETLNCRVLRTMNLSDEFKIANEQTKNDFYPYFLIDRTNSARVNRLQFYIDIFSKFPKVIMKNGVHHLISSSDFNRIFTKIDNEIAKYEPSTMKSLDTDTEQNLKTQTKQASIKDYYRDRKRFRRNVEKILRSYNKRSLYKY